MVTRRVPHDGEIPRGGGSRSAEGPDRFSGVAAGGQGPRLTRGPQGVQTGHSESEPDTVGPDV